jgi:phospholipid/cholesterol/gamma-HCH transport system substrate-binding protein
VVAAAVAAFGIGLSLIGTNVFRRNSHYRVYAVFDDATGLGVRSRAQIAGIPIGQVDLVELDQATSHAKVWIKVRTEFVLHRDASITKRSESILGDFLLDVHPGSPSEPPLKDGDEIRNVLRQPGMNEVFNSLNKIAGDIGDITGNLRKVLGGEEGENNIRSLIERLQRITQGIEKVIDVSGAKLDATLANFQKFSGDLSKITGGESQDIVAIIQNTRDATKEARDILRTVGDVIGSQQKGDLKEGVKSLKGNLDKLDKALANVDEITDKINKGEGTIGHLVNDDKLARNLDKASQSLTNLFGAADQLKIEVNQRTELFIGAPKGGSTDPTLANLGSVARSTAYNPWAKNYFGVRIIPRPDKWYGFDIVDDPRGLTRRVSTTNDCGGAGCGPLFPAGLQQTVTERQLKFSVYIAKRYGPVSGRFGILENTGGFGLKLHLANDALAVAADAFEFANPLKDHPRVKVYLDYRFLDHLLITAGADDLINSVHTDPNNSTRITSGRDYFIGAGVFFTDEDISKLIGLAASRF